MTGNRNPVPLRAKVLQGVRRKKDNIKAACTTINMEEIQQRRLQSPNRLGRQMSIRRDYNELGESIQARYTYELLQKVEDGDWIRCEEILKEDPGRVSVWDEENQVTPLHVASKNGHLEIMNLLLKCNADCNTQDGIGQTPLHLAATKDHFYCCQTLLNCPGIQVNIQNKAHDTPLHHAAKEGRYQICSAILDNPDADVNALNRKGMSPLHLASQENHDKVITLLINKGANWKQQDKNLYLPIHFAAQRGYPESCEVLMTFLDKADKDKTLRKTLKDGKTPLMLAAKGGHHKCCIKLTNANINAKDKDGNTALHYAAIGYFENTLAELLGMGAEPNTHNKKGNSPISEASSKKKINCLKYLVEKDAKLDVVNIKLQTILHCAADKNAEESLRYLLSQPKMLALIDQKDTKGCTPLHSAIKREAVECAEILLEYGASPTDICDGDMTPLHLAAAKGYTGICEKLLVIKEVQVSQEDNSKATPLHMAALRGSIHVCQMLIRKGARLTAVDKNGHTPLHVASAKGYAKVVKFLSKKGVPQRAKDDTRSTALHLAASNGFLLSCHALVANAKATLSEMDCNGKLPLNRAFDHNHDEVFKFLLQQLPYKDTNEELMLTLHTYMHIALKDNRLVAIETIIDSEWWMSGFRGENGHLCYNYRELIRLHPALAHKAQDKCIKHKKFDQSLTYDFRFFEDNYYVPTAKGKIAKSPYNSEGRVVCKTARKFLTNNLKWKQDHPISLMVGYGRHHLLQHPLTNAWLLHKWRCYMIYIFLSLLLLDVFFVASLNIFMGWTDNWNSVYITSNLTKGQICRVPNYLYEMPTLSSVSASMPDNETKELVTALNTTTLEEFNKTALNTTTLEEFYKTVLNPTTLEKFNKIMKNVDRKHRVWILLLLVSLIIFLLEVNYAYRLRLEYLSHHLVRLIGVLYTIPVLIPMDQCNYDKLILNEMQWKCGIIALLVAWMHLINTLNQLPMLSVFMPITRSFINSFIKVVVYILMLVFVFANLFHLMLKDHEAFAEVPQAMVKTIVWMLGDLDYDNTFLNPDHPLLHPLMVNFFFILFVTTLVGFLVNLAITQSSEKLDTFHSHASFHQDASRCMLFLRLDICFPYFQKLRTLGIVTENNNNTCGSNFIKRKLLMLFAIQEKQTDQPTLHHMEEQNKQMAALLKIQEDQKEDIKEIKHQLNVLIKAVPRLQHLE